MDSAMTLVQAYLRVNGFLTVAEYPILHQRDGGTFEEVTDIDILAVRFPQAGRVLPRPRRDQGEKMDTDPALGTTFGRGEVLIGEVKEGAVELNRALRRRSVLWEALRRFGMCSREELGAASKALAEEGTAELAGPWRARVMAFGSVPSSHHPPPHFLPFAHILDYLDRYLDHHWSVRDQSRFRDPAMNFLALMKKARTDLSAGDGRTG